ncbi:MAG TPA: metalloregulator ArsR/SmtB family transcription factor [Gemmatimonadales bacterium]|nr:metalloregulator ArsR/SmtB family transcription factor [Gemmatimonadales bacterium]
MTPVNARWTGRIRRDRLARAAEIIKLLGHRERLLILEALEAGERSVTELCARCGLGQAICSQHLRRLRQLDVVSCRREGANVYYRVTEPKVHHILECIRVCDAPRSAAPRKAK